MRCGGLRIRIVGTSGAGKTTLAKAVSDRLGIPHVELDEVHWKPDWVGKDDETFAADLKAATAGDSWVVCGGYTRVSQPVLDDRLTHWVWLDYSRWCVTSRVLRRTFWRSLKREELWAGNRESFSKALLSRDSIIWWSLTTYAGNRRKHKARSEHFRAEGRVQVVRFEKPAEAERWLDALAATQSSA